MTMIRAFLLAGLCALGLAGGDASAAEWSEEECLARAIYFEARDQPREGMEAIAAVILNRAESPAFPDTICGVVQDGDEDGGCQFHWWCDGKSDEPEDNESWAQARDIARLAMQGRTDDPTHGGMFFHGTAVKNPWVIDRPETARIGDHVFYGLAPSEIEAAGER